MQVSSKLFVCTAAVVAESVHRLPSMKACSRREWLSEGLRALDLGLEAGQGSPARISGGMLNIHVCFGVSKRAERRQENVWKPHRSWASLGNVGRGRGPRVTGVSCQRTKCCFSMIDWRPMNGWCDATLKEDEQNIQ